MRRMPFFKTLWAYKGAQLTIARLWFDRPLTAEPVIYGTSRRRYIFNGAMDIGNLMPRYAGGGSVVDVLIDEGEIIASYSEEELRQAVLEDLAAILPATRQAQVRRFLAAHIHPQVLYHREYPRLEHERLSGCRTPLKNFFLAGCWLGKIGISMESAVYAGRVAANAVLEAMGREDRVPIIPYTEGPLVARVRDLGGLIFGRPTGPAYQPEVAGRGHRSQPLRHDEASPP